MLKREFERRIFLGYFGSQIVLTGNSYMEIEGCRRIMEYNDIYLKIKTDEGMIAEIWGKDLALSDYNTAGIAVRGQITSIEFHGKGEGT